jgi:hypothetical protein
MTNPIGYLITVVIYSIVFIIIKLSWKSKYKRTYLIICQVLFIIISTLSTLIFTWFSIFDTGFIFILTLLIAISDTWKTDFCPACGAPVKAGQCSSTCPRCDSQPPKRRVGNGWKVIILVPISVIAVIAIFIFTPVIQINGNRCYQEAITAVGSNTDALDELGAPLRATALFIGPFPGSKYCEDTHFIIYGSKKIGVVILRGWNQTDLQWNQVNVWIFGKTLQIMSGQG